MRRPFFRILTALLTLICIPAAPFAQAQQPVAGRVVAWGSNVYGESTVPAGLTGVVAVSAGWFHTIALMSDGTVIGWGIDDFGQSTVPAGLTGVTAIAAGFRYSLALKSDGTVTAWGKVNVPADLTGVTAIAAGLVHAVALKSDGTVVAWGDNTYGKADVPADLTGVTAIAAGGTHTVVLKSDGTVVAWGDNTYGQVDVPAGLTGVTAISAGHYYTMALKSDGTVVAWGYNYDGETNVPADLTGVTAIAAGAFHAVVLKSDGTMVGWGDNFFGQASVPVGVSRGIAIFAGWAHTVAIYDPNERPTANAGGNRNATAIHSGNPGADTASLTLDGTGSSDPEGDTLSYAWTVDGIAAGNDSTQPVALSPGTHTVGLTVTDPYGDSSSDSATITVNPAPNGAPILAVLPPAQGTVGVPISISASAIDPDGDTLSYDLLAAPSGATINSSTGQVSWTPTVGGTYTITIHAADPYGAGDTKSVSVDVRQVLVESVTVSRDVRKRIVTVQFNVRNAGTTTVSNILLNSATLGGVNTTTRMPISIGMLRAGQVQKGIKVQFPGASVPPGPAVFIVNGTSSAGLVGANRTIAVP